METEELYWELLFKYFSGSLSHAEKEELLIWLKEKEEHRYLMDKMSDWWAVAHVPLFKSDLEADFKAYFHFLIGSVPEKQTKQIHRQLNVWIQAAAILLLLIGVGVSAFFLGRNSNDGEKLAYTETFAPNGSQTQILLPDSSTVLLNSGSSLKYRSDYNDSERKVELRGEAYFEIQSNPEKPFIVYSDKLNVKVKGTTFNVKAYEEEETIDVVLISGKVNIQLADNQQEDISLSPNQKISYNKKEEKTTVSVVNSANSILWTKGILYFYEKTFPEIARELERKYDTDIEIRSKSLNREVFTGSFSSDYTLDRVLKEIDMDNKYKYTFENRTLIITDK